MFKFIISRSVGEWSDRARPPAHHKKGGNTHTLIFHPNFRNWLGVRMINFDSTRRASHVHIDRTSQRVANSKTSGLRSWKFWPKYVTCLNESYYFRILHGENLFQNYSTRSL